MIGRREFVAFIDLSWLDESAAAQALAELARPDRLGSLVPHALVRTGRRVDAAPSGWTSADTGSPDQACVWAFDLAAAADLPLLILGGGALPSSEALGTMAEGLAVDPLVSAAIPRFARAGSDRLLLFERYRPGSATAPRRVLSAVTDFRFVAEQIAPCMLIRRELVGSLPFTPGGGLWPGLADYVLRARRAGFRPLLCNRAVVSMPAGQNAPSWGCSAEEVARVARAYAEPEAPAPPDDLAARGEHLLARLVDAPRSVLIDARNLTPVHNGTSVAILGACEALYRARPDREVGLWLHPETADAYQVRSRFREWTVHTTLPVVPYAAGVRLSQPWHASELDSMRDAAAVNLFWMLDTIAWDIGYVAARDLDNTWQRLGREADGILFISEFSRHRFAHRFTVAPEVVMGACPLSLDPDDYALPMTDGPQPPFWLVVGNHYDHKHVGPTVDLLARAFPTRRLVVFGDRDQPRAARVTRFESGRVDDAVVRGCYARADLVIFPSFYEGFGLPIVEGLTYDRTVVARDSSLVRELAARYRGPGRLFIFSTDRELIDLLGRLERGDATGGLPLTSTRGPDVWNWDAVARCMLQTIDALVAGAPSPQMRHRTSLARGIEHPQRLPQPVDD